MRNFSDIEKKFIRQIINTPFEEKTDKGDLIVMRSGDTLLRHFFNIVAIEIKEDKSSFSFYSDNKEFDIIHLLDIFLLIKYLEDNLLLGLNQIVKEKYVFVNPKYQKQGNDFIYEGPAMPELGYKKTEITVIIPKYTFNFQLASDVQRFCSSIYHPTSALIDLASDFKSPEQRIYTKHLRVAWAGVIVAIAIGLIGKILEFCK